MFHKILLNLKNSPLILFQIQEWYKPKILHLFLHGCCQFKSNKFSSDRTCNIYGMREGEMLGMMIEIH